MALDALLPVAAGAGRVGAGFIPDAGAKLGVQAGLTGLRGLYSGLGAAGSGAFGSTAGGLAATGVAAAPTAAAFSAAMAPVAIAMAIGMTVGSLKDARIEKGYIQRAKAALERFRNDPDVQQARDVLGRLEGGDRSPDIIAQLNHLAGLGSSTWSALRQPRGSEGITTQFKQQALAPIWSGAYKAGPDVFSGAHANMWRDLGVDPSAEGGMAQSWAAYNPPNSGWTGSPYPGMFSPPEWASMTGQDLAKAPPQYVQGGGSVTYTGSPDTGYVEHHPAYLIGPGQWNPAWDAPVKPPPK